MKLQILIPQYKETDEIIKPLLDSIALQQRVSFEDFEVIICNDGSDFILSRSLLDLYRYKIVYHCREPHRGISGTRNALMKYAAADYIMFCDADDMFFNTYGLRFILNEIEKNEFDMYSSAFLEELYTDEGFTYVEHKKDRTFIHGKVYRRQFLIDNDIHFVDSLEFHEDSCFNAIAENNAKECRYCETPFFMWKWREDSICRRDKYYNQSTTPALVDANDLSIEYFMSKGNDFMVRSFVTTHLFNMYYELNKPPWSLPECHEYLLKSEKRIGAFYVKYKDVWNSVNEMDRIRISHEMRQNAIDEGMLLERMSMPDWLHRIETLFLNDISVPNDVDANTVVRLIPVCR